MTESIIVALVTGVCSIVGILIANSKNQSAMDAKLDKQQAIIQEEVKHTRERLTDLADEVREHNNFARRMPVVEEQIKVINHRIGDLEKKRE